MSLDSIVFQLGKIGSKELARRMLGIEDQVTTMHGKVDAIREGRLNSGHLYLLEAKRASTDERARKALEDARHQFVRALGDLKGDDLRSAYAALQISLVHRQLRRPTEARDWAFDAYNYAVAAATGRCTRMNKILESPEAIAGDNSALYQVGGFAIAIAGVIAAISSNGIGGLANAFGLWAALAVVGVIVLAVIAESGKQAARAYTKKPMLELDEVVGFVNRVADYNRRTFRRSSAQVQTYALTKKTDHVTLAVQPG